ncbi:hybrid sensor histidine kinase/response regulator, partial [Vibrio jasicida]|uniref:hybrid sensor histidine kinase/response regulator n=1 Tax=Vibrio jasicida TaxID=766224 RepID=UPI0011B01C53
NIIDNLLSNAFKYSNGKGVQVKITLIDNSISISIRDYGRGIPSDKLEKVLHPYAQINKFEDIGSGLGLSIVHELIEQLGYELVIKSEEGEGTEFRILLKIRLGKSWTTEKRFLHISDESIRNERIWHDSLKCEDGKGREIIEVQYDIGLCDLLGIKYDLASRSDVERDDIHHSFSDLTVLVAEDFSLNQKLIARNLEKFDIIADFANDGIEVLKMISDKDYDVVFMDIKMPKKDGIQAAKDIRNGVNKNIHIYALTAAYDFEKTIEENENLFDGFLGKPMDIEKLVKVLKNVQERKIVG